MRQEKALRARSWVPLEPRLKEKSLKRGVKQAPWFLFQKERAMERSRVFFNLIEPQRPWLARQPNFDNGWESGCKWILEEIDSWVDGAVKELLPSPIETCLLDRCRSRVWAAWSYHWREAASVSPNGRMDGECVAALLHKGVRPGTSATLGGDPIRDSLLVEGCLKGYADAYERVRETYSEVFRSEKLRQATPFNQDILEEVWDGLNPVDEHSRAWLERYCG